MTLRTKLNIAVNKQIISSVPVFAGCSDEAMAAIIEQMYQMVLVPGECAAEQGGYGDEMFFIVRGRLEVSHRDEDGMLHTLAIREDGDFFGETALIRNAPRGATVKALTYCDLLVLSRKGFTLIGNQFPELLAPVEAASKDRHEMVKQLTPRTFTDTSDRVRKASMLASVLSSMRRADGTSSSSRVHPDSAKSPLEQSAANNTVAVGRHRNECSAA